MYPVDKTRANEFGVSYEEDKDKKEHKEWWEKDSLPYIIRFAAIKYPNRAKYIVAESLNQNHQKSKFVHIP